MFEQISFNEQTAVISYPKPEGFKLDNEAVYRMVAHFLPHCGGSLSMAVRQAVHQQLIAHQGLQTTFAGLKKQA